MLKTLKMLLNVFSNIFSIHMQHSKNVANIYLLEHSTNVTNLFLLKYNKILFFQYFKFYNFKYMIYTFLLDIR